MARRQRGIILNKPLHWRKASGCTRAATAAALWAALAVFTTSSPLTIVTRRVATVVHSITAARRASVTPITVGRTGARPFAKSRGRSNSITEPITRVRGRLCWLCWLHRSLPGLLGWHAVWIGRSRCRWLRRPSASSTGSSQRLNQSRNLIKRYALVGECLDQQNLLLRVLV